MNFAWYKLIWVDYTIVSNNILICIKAVHLNVVIVRFIFFSCSSMMM